MSHTTSNSRVLSPWLQRRLHPQRLPTIYIMMNGNKISEIAGAHVLQWLV